MNTVVLAPAQEATLVPAGAVPLLDHLSWSGIQAYSQCPRKFCYRYIEKAPVEFTPSALVFGGAFHKAVEHLSQARIEGATLPSVEALRASYYEAWKEESAKAPEIQHGRDENAASLLLMADRMLTAFRQHILDTTAQTAGAQIIAIEHAHRFKFLPDVPPIEMRLDLLELAGTDLVVTDLKTSRSRWNDLKVQEHLPQLVLYAIGLLPLLRELGCQRIVPRFLVVTKAKKPVVQVLVAKAGREDVDRLKRTVTETWDAIRKEVFVQREGWGCAQCPYRRRCLG